MVHILIIYEHSYNQMCCVWLVYCYFTYMGIFNPKIITTINKYNYSSRIGNMPYKYGNMKNKFKYH